MEEIDSDFSQPAPVDPDVWDLQDTDISHIDGTKKLIAITFDDAPSRTLENIFAVFADFNERNPDCIASATVFFNSNRFNGETTHLLASARALGLELGNHTHSHLDLTTLSQEQLREEIDKTDLALSKIDGKTRHLLRAPFGKTNELVAQVACAPIINWSIDTLDWQGLSENEIYDSVFANLQDGAIALMHDGYPHTVDALKRLLPDLKAEGYQAVSVSQLAKAHDCTLYRGKTYIRARKSASN